MRILIIAPGLLFVAVVVLYILYLSRFPTDGNLEWSQSSGLVKILLIAALLSGILSTGSFIVAVLGWFKGTCLVLKRMHYTAIGIAYALNIHLWTQLGFFEWIKGRLLSKLENNMSWKEFEKQTPRLALLGFEKLNRKVAYLALLNKDGSPRLHPVTPFIGNGMLFMFTEPSSPKIRDLGRDGRYALHCSVDRKDGEPLVEFLVSGAAKVISDKSVRAEAEKIAASPVVIHNYVLFEFRIDSVLLVEYDAEGKRAVQRWHLQTQPQGSQIITVGGSVETLTPG